MKKLFINRITQSRHTHWFALLGFSGLVLIVALLPIQSQSVIVPIPAYIDVDIPPPDNESSNDTIVRREVVVSGDTLSNVFERSGAGVTLLYKLIADDNIKKPIERIFPGQVFTFTFNKDYQLSKITFDQDKLNAYEIMLRPDVEATIQKVTLTPDIYTKYASAVINNSLFIDGSNAGLTDNMIMQLATLFGWDIDFALDIRSGDQFSLLYEEQYLAGEKLADGAILAARFVNNGREFIALRYTDAGGRTDYYSPNGDSMRKAFLRTPVDVFRISSRFNPNRMHPVLNRIVAHRGTDYAAPVGTPIRAAGEGKIVSAYYSDTFGNVVTLQHGETIRTLYAHMSKFASGIRQGNWVKQGQIIGYVGATGRVTGPHLHYEFLVNGVHMNPQTVQLPNAQPLEKQYLDDFTEYADNLAGQLLVLDQAYALNSATTSSD